MKPITWTAVILTIAAVEVAMTSVSFAGGNTPYPPPGLCTPDETPVGPVRAGHTVYGETMEECIANVNKMKEQYTPLQEQCDVVCREARFSDGRASWGDARCVKVGDRYAGTATFRCCCSGPQLQTEVQGID